ncbi:MAG: putative ABC transporter ATP-binding protein [Chloroflexi bacterium ADurb.Bin222]|nr:MAG: putative ABC transporter ATP-binding protein [Chloroflexi bacterium ADurb.Bin222]
MTEPIIHITNLTRHFQMGEQTVRALDGVDLTVMPGEFLAIMGPSGSGKSTLLYLIGGLDRPTGGEMQINQREITQLDENDLAGYRGKEVGFIFQAFHLVPTMTAVQNVEFPMIFSGVAPQQRRQQALALLERVGLGDRTGHRPTELSGGQQQRVAIARALANDPRIVLADEPTGNLDTQTGREVMALLGQLNREEGRTIIIVTHDPGMTAYATRTIHLLDGKITNGAQEPQAQ